jgi:hypothetical protein
MTSFPDKIFRREDGTLNAATRIAADRFLDARITRADATDHVAIH